MKSKFRSRKDLRLETKRVMSGASPIISHHGHHHDLWPKDVSRRRFLHASGLAAAGMLLGPALLKNGSVHAQAPGPGTPKPIPGRFEFNETIIHNLAPGVFDPTDTDPSSITDFDGLIAYGVVDGSGTHTNKTTGVVSTKLFEADLRFMQGVFVGTDHRLHHGTFAEI